MSQPLPSTLAVSTRPPTGRRARQRADTRERLFTAALAEFRSCGVAGAQIDRIAKAADVPLVLGFIDYRKKQMGMGITLPAKRNLADDLQAIRQFYAPFEGRIPTNTGPVEFPADYCPSDDPGPSDESS